MIAAETLAQIGVPMERAIAHVREARAERYASLREFYRGANQQRIVALQHLPTGSTAACPAAGIGLLAPVHAAKAERCGRRSSGYIQAGDWKALPQEHRVLGSAARHPEPKSHCNVLFVDAKIVVKSTAGTGAS
jgi:hypothetical protein